MTEIKINRPAATEIDGTQQGGLAFCVSFFGGSIVAAALAPGSLTSFWVWFALICASSAIASGAQKIFAVLPGKEPE